MGKVREGLTDIAGLTQWLGRKIANHHPMSVRSKVTENTRFDRKTKVMQDGNWQVGIVAENETQIIYVLADGRRFRFTVEEVDASEPMPDMVAVGF